MLYYLTQKVMYRLCSQLTRIPCEQYPVESTDGTYTGQKEQATIARADWPYLACPKKREFDSLPDCKTRLVEFFVVVIACVEQLALSASL